MECVKCGASNVRLFYVVSEKGIVKVCGDCAVRNNSPIVRTPVGIDDEKRESVRDRMEKISGVRSAKEPKIKINEEDFELKKIAEKNFESKKMIQRPDDLVNNFHWLVMRFRRRKKLTQAQFARDIGEAEKIIYNLEKGNLPENYLPLIRKVEDALSVNLIKGRKTFDEERVELKENILSTNEINLDDSVTRTLTIADLQEMKKKKEDAIFENAVFGRRPEKVEEEIDFSDENEEDKKDLSQDDMDRIIFGK